MRNFLLGGAAVALLTAGAAAQVPGLTGTIIVTNKTPSTATIIDLGSGRILATLPTGAGPHEVALSADGGMAVVTDYSGQPGRTLTVIDLPARQVVRTIDLGQYQRPHGIHFLAGDSLVAVTSEASGNVVVVNVIRGAIVKAVPTTQAGSHMVGIAADGRRAFTGNMRSHTVSQIDLAAGTFVRSWPVPNVPEAINVTPDGNEVWVGSNETGKISVLDPATGTIRTAAEGFGWPYRVLFSPDGSQVFLPDLRNEQLRFLDRRTHAEAGRLEFPGGGPQGITITPDGRFLLESMKWQARVVVIDAAEPDRGRQLPGQRDPGRPAPRGRSPVGPLRAARSAATTRSAT
ncbi:MAG: YncE family protein [Gemmatimonadales bacterium]